MSYMRPGQTDHPSFECQWLVDGNVVCLGMKLKELFLHGSVQ